MGGPGARRRLLRATRVVIVGIVRLFIFEWFVIKFVRFVVVIRQQQFIRFVLEQRVFKLLRIVVRLVVVLGQQFIG